MRSAGGTTTRRFYMPEKHYVHIQLLNRPESLPIRARYCDTFFCQLRGFTFRRSILPDEALLLVQARDNRLEAGIHMLGVWFDLSVFWIDSQGIVVDSVLARRWRPAYLPKRPARYILEMAPGRQHELHVGDLVSIEKISLV
jgi:uncharacterized membrane protein (UPF0127 family)